MPRRRVRWAHDGRSQRGGTYRGVRRLYNASVANSSGPRAEQHLKPGTSAAPHWPPFFRVNDVHEHREELLCILCTIKRGGAHDKGNRCEVSSEAAARIPQPATHLLVPAFERRRKLV